MAPAGIISPVPGAGGRAALFAAARWVSPRPSTASLGSATAGVSSPLRPPKGGIVAAAPGVRGRGALLARRSGPLHSAMGTAPRLEVAAGGFGARLFATSSSGSPAAAAPRASALRRGARLLPSAGKSEGTQAQEEGEGTPVEVTPVPTPWKRLMSRFKEAGAKLLEEAKKSAFTVFLLLLALGIGTLASVKIPGSSCADTIVSVCDKGEKFHKFASHFVPYIVLFINHFLGK